MLKNWIVNIGLGLVVSAVMLWLVFLWMGWYTHHGTSIEVPNLTGVPIETAIEKLDDAGLRYEIADSVYNQDLKKDAITEQDPLPGFQVKPNRIIYITVNSLGKPKVKMPKLIDLSFTLGKALLKNAGLVLGNVEYRFDDIGHNLVIDQKSKGVSIPAGKLLEKGTAIDLVVSTSKNNNYQQNDSIDLGVGSMPDIGIQPDVPDEPKKDNKPLTAKSIIPKKKRVL